METFAQGFYRTNLLFGGREGNQTDYLIEITNIRKTIHAHAMAGAQCTFKIENAYINELPILFSSIQKEIIMKVTNMM